MVGVSPFRSAGISDTPAAGDRMTWMTGVNRLDEHRFIIWIDCTFVFRLETRYDGCSDNGGLAAKNNRLRLFRLLKLGHNVCGIFQGSFVVVENEE